MSYTKQDVLRLVEEEDVEFIRLQFTDMFGTLKNVAITSSQLKKALDNQFSFNGRAIEGFAGLEETKLYLYPNLDTLTIFPWRPQQGKVARLICDVYNAKRQPFEGDSRYILKRVLEEAEALGCSFDIGPECEFFLYHADDEGQPTTITHEKAGYFDLGPMDLGENARRDMVLSLEDMGFEIEASYHEAAPAQHEIDFQHDQPLATADNIMTFRLAVKTIAKRHGLHASFMPKPRADVNGSGMHINITFTKREEDAKHFVGGLIQHMEGMTAITNPLVNSYKRLAVKSGPFIRTTKGETDQPKVELCFPDSSSNPYLVLAVCLAAGLSGIKNQTEPTNVEKGMPNNLLEAIQAFEKDELLKSVLGENVSRCYVQAKKQEWNEYCRHVSEWEIDRYLYKI